MKISATGLEIIKASEALRLVAYRPTPTDVWTIGWGHTHGVRPGDRCTPAQADQWLAEDCFDAEFEVEEHVTVPLSQSQFDALVSFTYNCGGENLAHSTLLRLLNAGDYAGAAAQFPRWNKDNGKVLPGLVIRREKERHLFLTPTGEPPCLPTPTPSSPSFWSTPALWASSALKAIRWGKIT